MKVQCLKIAKYLETKGATTQEMRDDLDIMHPAARIMELRQAGYDIATVKKKTQTNCGRITEQACYHLIAKPEKGA